MLCDPTGLPGGYLGVTQIIEQRRFPMVYMPHDSHDWRARCTLKRFDLLLRQVVLGITVRHRPRGMAHFLDDQRRGVLIEHLVDRYLEKSGGPDGEVGPRNVVTSVLASYRGYDTMGEVAVVFAAAVGVMLLLGVGFATKRKDSP